MDYQADTIHAAALNGDFNAVQSLLHSEPQSATSTDGDGRTPLHWACVSGSLDIFRLLMSLEHYQGDVQQLEALDKRDGFGSYHIDINASDDGGWTPLMIAISAGYEDIYQVMLDVPSIDVSHVNRGGQSVLHFAASKGRIPAVVKILSCKDGKPLLRIRDRQGQLPLHRAAAAGSAPIIAMLLEGGSQLNVSDAGGWTALHHACSEAHGDVAVKLIHEGIDLDKTDNDNKTAIQLCPSDGKCAKFIRSNCPDSF